MAEEVNRAALDVARIARDVAMDILGIDKIIALHGLSLPEWEALKRSPDFQRTLVSYVKEWNEAANTKERVAVKSAHLVEASLEWIMENLGDPDIPFIQKLEALKFAARLGDLGAEGGRGGATAGERVLIQIVTSPHEQVKIETRVPPGPLIEGEILKTVE